MNRCDYPLTLLYDGSCPVCLLEMEHLMARNALKRLAFVDISAPDFDATARTGGQATLAQMQALIHGLRPDGSLLAGAQVLRLAYEAVGLGAWVPGWHRWRFPGFSLWASGCTPPSRATATASRACWGR